MKSLKMSANIYRKARARGVIGFSDHLLEERRLVSRGDIPLSTKVLQYLVRVKWQRDFVSLYMQERGYVRKMSVWNVSRGRHIPAETRTRLSETEKTGRRPTFVGHAKSRKFFGTQVVTEEGGVHCVEWRERSRL
jgi:hypothetical protein